jgi:hypothetical protein
LPQLVAVPVHEAIVDHEQFAARQVALVVLAEQTVGVIEHPVSPLQTHPRSEEQAMNVALTLFEQAAGVPPHASVAESHEHPVCVEQSDWLFMSLQRVGVPPQQVQIPSGHAQPDCATQAAEVV